MVRRSWSRRCTASRRTATSSPRPACLCTSPSTRPSRSSAPPRSTRPPSRATRCRPSADGSSPTAHSPPSRRTRSARRCATRCRPPSPSASRARSRTRAKRSPTPRPRSRFMAHELPYIAAIGEARVRVTPISETAEIGIAIGAALSGFRPVVELYMAEFMLVAMDQVLNEAPRFRGMSGGQVTVPIVLKAGYGFTAGWAGQHTGTINALFMGVPGLKVVVPSTAADAKGLMATAIRDDNPVVYLHNYLLTLDHGDVPDGEYTVPFGQADVRRSGGDVTIVAIGAMVGRALTAAEALAADGIEAEVIDPRTLNPLDLPAILASVEKTGHLVLADQATRHGSASAIIAADVAD